MADKRRKKNTSIKYKIDTKENTAVKKVLLQVRDWVLDHSRVAFPALLIVCVAITVVIALSAKKPDKVENESVITDETVPGQEQEIGVPDEPEELQMNAYPEVNAIISTYYTAMAEGKVEDVEKISNSVEDAEKIRITEMSKYIENYPVIEVYTKSGPAENSYLAYVYTKVKFRGYDNVVPGMQAFYICQKEDGTLYINEGEEEQYVTSYITEVSLQEDVVVLYNKMTVEYNELLVNDPQLGVFLKELAKQVDVAVGEILAAAETDNSQTEPGTEETPDASAEENNANTDAPAETVPKSATTTTTINVRSSDSETADKLGKLEMGTKVDVLEMRANGWTKITFEGKEAYVKSEYLKAVEDASQIAAIGTVTVLSNVNIRAAADETSERLGVVYEGEKLDLIEQESNGWCKVKYKDQAAYVKAEYVQQ